MGIILTNKEILGALNEFDKHFQDVVYASDKRIAEAQVKKVAKYISELPTDGHDKWYFYHQTLVKSLLDGVERRHRSHYRKE